ncbi:hypothetical protein BDP55DRAFT_634712 [Colletotrichum godetiae]|uniref:Uncharacterized protein n=1 Tax=Colletotrichum godetiae TaxID=1209918 RepID=A0AAJ0EUX5_9PEZI|nr:uncharacterized protein BDP55DRAFT_634712 [Colletotrichum godetiae]KAK1672700.1 hypothetical protein BDP55DRAFT_634712 [Colletotrichum godetiae]
MLPASYHPPPSPELETRYRIKHPCMMYLILPQAPTSLSSPLHLTLTRNQKAVHQLHDVRHIIHSATLHSSPTVRPPPPAHTPGLHSRRPHHPHTATDDPWQCRPGCAARPFLYSPFPSHIPPNAAFIHSKTWHPFIPLVSAFLPPSFVPESSRERKSHSRHLGLSHPSHSLLSLPSYNENPGMRTSCVHIPLPTYGTPPRRMKLAPTYGMDPLWMMGSPFRLLFRSFSGRGVSPGKGKSETPFASKPPYHYNPKPQV